MGYLKYAAALALAMMITAQTPAEGPDMVNVEIGISAGYDAQCAALIAGDTNAWAATLAPDFTPVMPDGKRGDAATARAGVAALLASTKIEKCRILPESIRLDGNEAIVEAAIGMSGTNARGPIAIEQHAVDRWIQSGKKWLQKSSTVSEQKVTP